MAERMKAIDYQHVIAANMNGRMNFRVETDTVQVTTYYKDLAHPDIGKSIQCFYIITVDVNDHNEVIYINL
jgi:hypothetical protein